LTDGYLPAIRGADADFLVHPSRTTPEFLAL